MSELELQQIGIISPINNGINKGFDLNNMCMIMSTLLTTYIVSRYKIGTVYYCLLQSLLLQIMLYLIFNYDSSYQSIISTYIFDYIWYPFILLPLYACVYAYNVWRTPERKLKNYIKINIYDENLQKIIMNYVKANSDFYNIDVNTDYGDVDNMIGYLLCRGGEVCDSIYREYSSRTLQTVGTYVNFKDTYLGIKGYYIWNSIHKKEQHNDPNRQSSKEITSKFIEFNILEKRHVKINPDQIIQKIKDKMTSMNEKNVTLTYFKMLYNSSSVNKNKKKYHSINFYTGPKRNVNDLEKLYINTMFHPKKDRLWQIIKNGCLNPEYYRQRGQVGRTSLLLYGPPGTGKSTFAFRIANTLNRHILSLDLRNWSKIDIYEEFQYPCSSHFVGPSYKDFVYLFEEFDISIKDLNEREKISTMDESYHYYKMRSKYKSRYSELNGYGPATKSETEKSSIIEKAPVETNNKEIKAAVDNKAVDTKDATKETETSTTYVKAEFTVRDLLELFQGPVPFEGMVILATTNKYDDIKKICPELFRPGRMTPVYFGYIDKDTLQDISMHFFKKKLQGRIPETITIPTSQIIDLALESEQITDDSFKHFSNEIFKLFDNM